VSWRRLDVIAVMVHVAAAQLWLGGNTFGDAEACAFAVALDANSTLQALSFANDRSIGDASATAFAKANHALTLVCFGRLPRLDDIPTSVTPLLRHHSLTWEIAISPMRAWLRLSRRSLTTARSPRSVREGCAFGQFARH